MMSKLFRLIFKEYEEDDVSIQVHSGVGYSGIQYSYWYGSTGRKIHCGVGYGGIYDE
jgi:hypothetical protein